MFMLQMQHKGEVYGLSGKQPHAHQPDRKSCGRRGWERRRAELLDEAGGLLDLCAVWDVSRLFKKAYRRRS